MAKMRYELMSDDFMNAELPDNEVVISELTRKYYSELTEMWDVFKCPSKAVCSEDKYISSLDAVPAKLDKLKEASIMLVKIRLAKKDLDPNDIVMMTNDIYNALSIHTIRIQTGGENRAPTKLESICCNELLARIRDEHNSFRAFCDMTIDGGRYR